MRPLTAIIEIGFDCFMHPFVYQLSEPNAFKAIVPLSGAPVQDVQGKAHLGWESLSPADVEGRATGLYDPRDPNGVRVHELAAVSHVRLHGSVP